MQTWKTDVKFIAKSKTCRLSNPEEKLDEAERNKTFWGRLVACYCLRQKKVSVFRTTFSLPVFCRISVLFYLLSFSNSFLPRISLVPVPRLNDDLDLIFKKFSSVLLNCGSQKDDCICSESCTSCRPSVRFLPHSSLSCWSTPFQEFVSLID